MEKKWTPLPRTMPAAIELFRTSPLVRQAFDSQFVDHLVTLKEDEWKDFASANASPELALSKGPVSDWEIDRYLRHC